MYILREEGKSGKWYQYYGDRADPALLECDLPISQPCLYPAYLLLEVYPTSTCTRLFYMSRLFTELFSLSPKIRNSLNVYR